MKKIIAGVVGLVMAMGAQAQTGLWDSGKPAQPVTFGVRAGMNVATVGGDEDDAKSKIGFFGGLGVDFNIVNSLSINSGLFFTQKGCKTDDIDMDIEGYPMDANARFTMNFIELPVYLSYRLPLNLESSLQVFFGPYFDYGVYGKATADVKFKGELHGEKVSQSMDLFDDDYDFKRFHVGLGLGAAYTWSRFSVGLSYQWGMTEVVADAESYWNNFNISVGYNF